MEANITLDDAGAFNMPWSAIQCWRRQQGSLIEDACSENIPNYFNYDVAPIPQADKPDF